MILRPGTHLMYGNHGNKEDALCREPQTHPAHRNRFAFCHQGPNEKLSIIKLSTIDLN